MFMIHKMDSTELVYFVSLLTSLMASFLVKQASGDLKRFLCFGFGLIFAIFICGKDIWHALVLSFGLVIFYSLVSFSFIHYIVFLWGFAYLGIFHNINKFGFTKPSEFTTAYQLFLTLRVVGVAFEVHDTHKIIQKLKAGRQKNESELKLRLKYKGVLMSPYDILSYVFCYIGMLSGPFYTYRSYHDFIQGLPACAPPLNMTPFYQRIQEVPFFLLTYVVGSYFFSPQYILSEKFRQEPLIYRLFYIGVIMFIYRMRLYFAWILGECVCMNVGLGAYPVCSRPISGEGPRDLERLHRWMDQQEHGVSINYELDKNGNDVMQNSSDSLIVEDGINPYSFATIQNVSVWKCEFAPSCRKGMKFWNMTVRYWFVNNVYHRCPGPKIPRAFLTVMVTALWLGVHPGNFLAFAMVPFIMIAERGILTLVVFSGLSVPPGGASLARWLLKMRSFEYLGLAFLFPGIEELMACWSTVGYYIKFIVFILAALQIFLYRFVAPYNIRELMEQGGEGHPGWRKWENDKWTVY